MRTKGGDGVLVSPESVVDGLPGFDSERCATIVAGRIFEDASLAQAHELALACATWASRVGQPLTAVPAGDLSLPLFPMVVGVELATANVNVGPVEVPIARARAALTAAKNLPWRFWIKIERAMEQVPAVLPPQLILTAYGADASGSLALGLLGREDDVAMSRSPWIHGLTARGSRHTFGVFGLELVRFGAAEAPYEIWNLEEIQPRTEPDAEYYLVPLFQSAR